MNKEQRIIEQKKQLKIDSMKKLLISKDEEQVYHELEQKTLGKIALLNPDLNLDMIAKLVVYQPKDLFTTKLNQFIFSFEKNTFSKDKSVDLDALEDAIMTSNDDELIEMYKREGSIDFLIRLTKASQGTSRDLDSVLSRLKTVRKKQQILNKMLSMIDDFNISDTNLGKLELQLANINNTINDLKDDDDNASRRISEILFEWKEQIYDIRKNGKENIGLKSFYPRLDTMIGGYRPDQMVVIGARPGVGKTAFILNLLERFVLGREPKDIFHEKVKDPKHAYGLFFSLEMSSDELLERLMSMETQIKVRDIRNNELTDEDYAILSSQSENTELKGHLYINDNPGININDIISETTRVSEEVPHLDFIIVDYLQLIKDDSQNRQQAVAKISRELKIIAKKYNCVVFALAQLNRQVEQRADHKPTLADLRESGQIEQDADIIMMMSEDPDSEQDTNDSESNNQQEILSDHINLSIVKNRSGSRGNDDFLFHKEVNTFHEMTDEEVKNLNEYKEKNVENNSTDKRKEKTTEPETVKNVSVLRDQNENSKIIITGKD